MSKFTRWIPVAALTLAMLPLTGSAAPARARDRNRDGNCPSQVEQRRQRGGDQNQQRKQDGSCQNNGERKQDRKRDGSCRN